MNKNIEVIALVYMSIDYLNLITSQLKSDNCKVDGWNVGIRLVLNDATDEVKEAVKQMDIPHSIFENEDPNEYYINRVYRAYNYGVTSSEYDNVCLVNSDNVFSRNWLWSLLQHHNGINIPCSFLIESGKRGLGPLAIAKNFGRTPSTIDFKGFEDFADGMKINVLRENGLYMPCVFEKSRFVEGGMYPEGNVYATGIGNFGDRFVESGDVHLFNRLKQNYNMKHVSVMNSIVYHVQEGELDESKNKL